MMTIRVSINIDDDRRVVVTLPPEVPIGEADLVVTVVPRAPNGKKRPRSSLAEWAEQHAEHWGNTLNSSDVESFTGRRF
ncbi:MAG TPA: hypothetical protein VK395_35955 [Gemmataceae bacterium]|nr:hypothetical protein [Gemmataceae bacterium]